MSEIELALAEWVEKQEAEAKAKEEYARAKNECDAAYVRSTDASLHATIAGDRTRTAWGQFLKAADACLPQIRGQFKIIGRHAIIRTREGEVQILDCADAIGEAKPKAEGTDCEEVRLGDLPDGAMFSPKYRSHTKRETRCGMVRDEQGWAFSPDTMVFVWPRKARISFPCRQG